MTRILFVLLGALLVAGCASLAKVNSPGERDWVVEAESPHTHVSFAGGLIDADSPAGMSLWYREPLFAPVEIRFEAMPVAEGGPNDHVSDINAFWMATDPTASGGSVLEHPRTGRFDEYDLLKTYYVGIGGNRNSTTRFRRYTGRSGDPLSFRNMTSQGPGTCSHPIAGPRSDWL